ncbi:MAG TPA: hypothetical protein VHZ03_46640 [Trebonia sp.]|nr:hypothetical protein [Trebonia sp.]
MPTASPGGPGEAVKKLVRAGRLVITCDPATGKTPASAAGVLFPDQI